MQNSWTFVQTGQDYILQLACVCSFDSPKFSSSVHHVPDFLPHPGVTCPVSIVSALTIWKTLYTDVANQMEVYNKIRELFRESNCASDDEPFSFLLFSFFFFFEILSRRNERTCWHTGVFTVSARVSKAANDLLPRGLDRRLLFSLPGVRARFHRFIRRLLRNHDYWRSRQWNPRERRQILTRSSISVLSLYFVDSGNCYIFAFATRQLRGSLVNYSRATANDR